MGEESSNLLTETGESKGEPPGAASPRLDGSPERDGRSTRSHIVFALALVLAGYLAWVLRDELVLLYVSGLFAVVLMPVVRGIEGLQLWGWRPDKGWAVAAMLIALAAFLAGFGFLAIPPVARDLEQISAQAPRLPDLIGKLRAIPFVDRLPGNQLIAEAQGLAGHAAGYILVAVKNWAGRMVDLVTGVVLTVYFIVEGEKTYGWFLSFLPPAGRNRLDKTLRRAGQRMGRWLLGQASLMVMLGVCSTVVYAALGVRYAYALGVLTGLLNIVPVLGITVTIGLVLAIAAIDSWMRVLGVAVFFIVYVQIENSFLVPRIMKSRVDLPGLAVLVALLLGFGLAGVPGALVAVPTAALVAELLGEYLVWKEPPLAGSA